MSGDSTSVELARPGGLTAYEAELRDMYRRTASFVDKILTGAEPGDLPVERATTFQLLINLTVAQALGCASPRRSYSKRPRASSRHSG